MEMEMEMGARAGGAHEVVVRAEQTVRDANRAGDASKRQAGRVHDASRRLGVRGASGRDAQDAQTRRAVQADATRHANRCAAPTVPAGAEARRVLAPAQRNRGQIPTQSHADTHLDRAVRDEGRRVQQQGRGGPVRDGVLGVEDGERGLVHVQVALRLRGLPGHVAGRGLVEVERCAGVSASGGARGSAGSTHSARSPAARSARPSSPPRRR
jgi:hypothetical protein